MSRTIPWFFLVSLVAVASGLVGACSGPDPSSAQTCTADLVSIQESIFAKSCAQQGCHAAVEPAAFLDLSSAGLEGRLVGRLSATCENRLLIDPGRPGQSFLLEKLNAEMPSCGARMPPAGNLSAEEIACVEQWITGLPIVNGDGGTDAPSCETCGGAGCVDLTTDSVNCGMCGMACPPGASCMAGSCACSGSLTACGGACVDTNSDAMNCGACGNACDMGKFCNVGICGMTCGTLQTCGASCVDTNTSLTNCGACGNICAAGTTCLDGGCACPGGGTSCGGKCVDTQTDLSNCGACGKTCAAGQTCAGGSCTCGNSSVSFATDVQTIFTANCASAGCHKGMAPQEGLDLSVGNAYADLVNVAAKQCNDGRKLVLPGDPAQSYLIDKMMGVDLCSGTKMPKNGILPSQQITTIANWICAGAPNN
jgi:hypothetical protein